MTSMHSTFRNRQMLIASMHGKEKAMAPLLTENLGVYCYVESDFNTDLFGTFDGSVARLHDPLTTLENKIRAGMQAFGYDLAVGSEGSFGPHPDFPVIASDQEWVMLIDDRQDLKISAFAISAETNFSRREIRSAAELREFAAKARFPSHGLILKTGTEIIKGITDSDELFRAYQELGGESAEIVAETDMRAMFNPSRMKVITQATGRLLEKLSSLCPECSFPGFAITELVRGLPCAWCGLPTHLPLAQVLSCTRCACRTAQPLNSDKPAADPQHCDHCNP